MQHYIGVTGRNECHKVYFSKFSLICYFRLIVSLSCKNLSSLFLSLHFYWTQCDSVECSLTISKAQMHGAVITLLLLCSLPPATRTNCWLLSEVCGPQQQSQTITLQELFTQPLPLKGLKMKSKKVKKQKINVHIVFHTCLIEQGSHNTPSSGIHISLQ